MKLGSSTTCLEIAAHSLQSALNAERGGADRIELCTALPTGGLTPSPGLLRSVLQKVSLPIHVLIRPRLGDFFYHDLEIETMLSSISYCRDLGVAGVVIGCLDRSGAIHLDHIEQLINAGHGMDITFHRAFDLIKQPFHAIEQLIDLGFDRILTSGQASNAWLGRALLARLQQEAGDRITIMPGAGVKSNNIAALRTETGCLEFHSSAKVTIDQSSTQDTLEITTIFGHRVANVETDIYQVRLLREALISSS